jgi:phage terminase large subunit-like protein
VGDAASLSTWNFACPDWVERLKDGRSLVPDLPLFTAEADRAVAIFNKLRLPDVPGMPTMREAAGEWFRDIVRALFGSVSEDGIRHVPELFALVPKKNSKTTGGAGIMITAMLVNKRPRAQFFLFGPTQDIADLAFQQASGMIEADPVLEKRFKVIEHRKAILDRRNKAMLRIMTFDMKVATGIKPAGVLIDEIHVMSSLSYASRVLGQIRGGLLANPEGFLIIITTQSDEPPSGVFRSELQYARAVRDGRVTEDVRVLPVLYEFPEAMQIDKAKPWQDPKNWSMVLPNLGLSITLPRLIADYGAAKEKGDEEERRWVSQHLNVEIGLASHTGGWRGADYWLDQADTTLSLDELMARSEVVTVGIDGGGLDDLLGLAVCGREKRRGDGLAQRWFLWCHAYAQSDVLELRKDIAELLRDFANDGQLTICTDVTDDIAGVADTVEKLFHGGLLPQQHGIGFDPQGVAAMVDELNMRGIEGDMAVAISQGFRLSPAVWGMERKLKDGTLIHDGSRMMAWCIGNAKTEQRGNAVLITKQTAGKAKIDPLIAAFNAVMLMSRNPEAAGSSVYRERGILAL